MNPCYMDQLAAQYQNPFNPYYQQVTSQYYGYPGMTIASHSPVAPLPTLPATTECAEFEWLKRRVNEFLWKG